MFSLLTLIDDIASTLDDVAAMTKVAIGKTSALMSDDLAVNAAVVTGVNPDRELPIVKAIFLGSLLNKLYCIIGVLLFMAFYPPFLKVILFIGGLYLCYEGAHKVFEKLLPKKNTHSEVEFVFSEKEKIKGAVRTDLVLSIEILVIANESISGTFLEQVLSLSAVSIAASILIYGLVALLVKLDDLGLYFIKKEYKQLGLSMVNSMPFIMKGLGILGTLAMFLVGGGIIVHTFHIPLIVAEIIQNLAIGFVTGNFLLVVAAGILKLKPKS